MCAEIVVLLLGDLQRVCGDEVGAYHMYHAARCVNTTCRAGDKRDGTGNKWTAGTLTVQSLTCGGVVLGSPSSAMCNCKQCNCVSCSNLSLRGENMLICKSACDLPAASLSKPRCELWLLQMNMKQGKTCLEQFLK